MMQLERKIKVQNFFKLPQQPEVKEEVPDIAKESYNHEREVNQ